MAKIIGNTTTTPVAIPDWNQTDETKVDYIKNKPTILTEEDIKQIAGDSIINEDTEFVFVGGDASNHGVQDLFVVDDALSLTSTNPVQNKVVSEAINQHGDNITKHENAIAKNTQDIDERPTYNEVVDIINSIQSPVLDENIFYATPQMHGAVGDGLTDDTQALNDCLSSNKYVFIPKGFYKISQALQIMSNDHLTVKCDTGAIFIADIHFSSTNMLYISTRTDDFSEMSCSWEGGIFCCNGLEEKNGIRCTQYSRYVVLKDITIVDIGNNGIGVWIDAEGDTDISGKHHIDNIKCFGQTFYIGGVLPREASETNPYNIEGKFRVAGEKYDEYIERDNTALKVYHCWDFEIGTFYVMGCRVGIDAEGSRQVGVHYYHYWWGVSVGKQISYDNYKKTRAFVAKNGAYWHFDTFYPDQPYIAFEGDTISCDYTHYICPNYVYKDDQGNISYAISNVSDGESPLCYLAKPTTKNCNIRFGDFNINRNDYTINDNITTTKPGKLPCAGVQDIYTEGNKDFTPYYRGGIQVEYKYLPTDSRFLHPSWTHNFSHQSTHLNYVKNSGWRILGYICANVIGSITFKITSSTSLLNAEVTIKNKNNDTVITKAEDLYHTSANPIINYIGLGTSFNENGITWVPLLFKSDCESLDKYFISVQSEYRSRVPFVITVQTGTQYNTSRNPADRYGGSISSSQALQDSIYGYKLNIRPDGKTGKRTILLIGDSYSCPRHLGSENPDGWGKLVKQQFEAMGYSCVANGMGGTGFIRGVNGTTFATLLNKTAPQTIGNSTVSDSSPVATPSEVTDIIVCGGYNDISTDEAYSKDNIKKAIKQFITSAKKQYQNATIYIGMVGTSNRYKTSGDDTIDNTEFELRMELLKNTVLPAYKYGDYRCYYLNNVEDILKSRLDYMYVYDTQSSKYRSDGIHPTQKGCEALADGIVKAFVNGNFF